MEKKWRWLRNINTLVFIYTTDLTGDSTVTLSTRRDRADWTCSGSSDPSVLAARCCRSSISVLLRASSPLHHLLGQQHQSRELKRLNGLIQRAASVLDDCGTSGEDPVHRRILLTITIMNNPDHPLYTSVNKVSSVRGFFRLQDGTLKQIFLPNSYSYI